MGNRGSIPEPFLEWATSALRASERAVLGGGLLGQASRDFLSPGRFVVAGLRREVRTGQAAGERVKKDVRF